MIITGPFFSSPPTGDHTPADGLTRLQTAFAGASSEDISAYANGPGTNDEMTINDGYATTLFDSNLNYKSLLWDDADIILPLSTSPLTAEFFFMAEEVNHTPGDGIKFAQFSFNSTGFDFCIPSYAYGVNYVRIVQSGFSDVEHPVTMYGGMHHIALVNRSTGTDIYVDGTRVIASRAPYISGTTGTLQLGGVGRGDTRLYYYGCRVRYAEMYSGASPGMPSGPAAWGPP
jgi:hypothetical protein